MDLAGPWSVGRNLQSRTAKWTHHQRCHGNNCSTLSDRALVHTGQSDRGNRSRTAGHADGPSRTDGPHPGAILGRRFRDIQWVIGKATPWSLNSIAIANNYDGRARHGHGPQTYVVERCALAGSRSSGDSRRTVTSRKP